ncbi:MAG: 2Fe-2S iron-sulfur cluster-binding protein [Bernardetiaceae bacterium]
MPTLCLKNWSGRCISLPDTRETLLAAIHRERLDWMHLCGGRGRCVTCRIQIIEGMEHLSPLTAPEERFRKLDALRPDERLTCQATCLNKDLQARIEARTPKATQLPHMTYPEVD